MLSDFTEYCNDSIGVTSSIWDRIKKVGEDRFYRVEYPEKQDGSELSFDDKRNEDKKYVNEEGSTFLLNTSIADSDYVRSVIETFVNKNKAFEEKLYHEKK